MCELDSFSSGEDSVADIAMDFGLSKRQGICWPVFETMSFTKTPLDGDSWLAI
jgi:hypothetical protein